MKNCEICARDGFSGKIVAFATMPIKNNVLIYDHVYRLEMNGHTHAHTCTSIDFTSIDFRIIE